MLAKFLVVCGYSKPEEIVDLVMTGVAVVPIVVGLGCDLEAGFMVLLVMLPLMFLVFPWSHSREEIRQREAEEHAAYLRRLTGKDR